MDTYHPNSVYPLELTLTSICRLYIIMNERRAGISRPLSHRSCQEAEANRQESSQKSLCIKKLVRDNVKREQIVIIIPN